MSETALAVDDGKIACAICGAKTHAIGIHLKREHPEMTLEQYQTNFPGAPVLSDKARTELARVNAEREAAATTPHAAPAAGSTMHYAGFSVEREALHELFGLGSVKPALSHKGGAIPVSKVVAPEEHQIFVPAKDENYIFPIALLKCLLLGLEMNIPAYAHGHMGTGKSTLFEQICARTGRPMLRVQHTNNMEESHVLGGWRVKDGETIFELGPLPFAMKYGYTYLADEYDCARPGVLAVYQPVLEGKPLIIKEADHDNRVIKPHPLFRFVATGNTNGTGDETGLYQGTIMQNAANYSRFGIMEEVGYMEKKMETGVIAGQGQIPAEEAEKLVDFARMIREAYTNGKMGMPIGPRDLIYAAKIGKRLGSMKVGLEKAFLNRLTRIDKETAIETLNRTAIS